MAEAEGLADWMSKLNETFTTVPLCYIAIPGSHDAMAYSLDMDSPLLEPDSLITMDLICCGCCRSIVKNWSITQEAMEEVDTWLGKHSKEVVILAFSHFKKMSTEQHTKLITFLKDHFKAKLCPDYGVPKLKDCWKKGYQVILSYDDINRKEDPVLWRGIEYWWANNSDPNEAISFLDNKKQSGRPNGFFVAGLNLTFYGCSIFWNLTASLKEKTVTAYPLLLDWVKKQRPGSDTQSINIIAGDFFDVNSFAQDIIQLNDAKTN
ncbi:PI-PLC X domain-containing protein 1-like isoform X1 [Danio rerio]|uniref:PI-PLC X domain-containing protein 1-like isoform X1 n=1 Tax=Danio rerio TaxID=7955 RepID=A0AC58JQS0_DANRE